jgi:hypothetical protein
MADIAEPAPSYDEAERADQPKAYKLCRQCRGWGVVTITHPGGLMSTEDCRPCAGTGEEI